MSTDAVEAALEKLDAEQLGAALGALSDAAALTAAARATLARIDAEFERTKLRKIKWPALGLCAVHAGACVERGADADALAAAAFGVAVRLVGVSDDAKAARLKGKALRTLMRHAELLYCAVVARCSVATRRQLAAHADMPDLRRWATELRWSHRALHHAACLLDDEPLLVLCPADRWGARLSLRGVADNAQLQWLVADALHGALPDGVAKWGKPPPQMIAAFKGEQLSETALGDTDTAFNMYNWFALDQAGDLKGPMMGLPAQQTWVWTEGTPSDIDVCDRLRGGRDAECRVLLIGPAPYSRKISVERHFAALKAAVKVEKMLTKKEVDAELEALANVAEHIKASSTRRVRLETNVGRDEIEREGEVRLVPHEQMFAPNA